MEPSGEFHSSVAFAPAACGHCITVGQKRWPCEVKGPPYVLSSGLGGAELSALHSGRFASKESASGFLCIRETVWNLWRRKAFCPYKESNLRCSSQTQSLQWVDMANEM